MEPQNYVRALLHSDSELEMLSRKIRSQLRQSEMVELAEEAERAADAGEERFSAKPSTFGEQDNFIPRKSKRQNNGTSSTTRKVKVLELRDITEVIPSFKNLHIHARTHMHRRGVKEGSLMFREVANKPSSSSSTTTHNKKEGGKVLHVQLASDLASQSFTIFENMTGLSNHQLQKFSQDICDRTTEGGCSPNLCALSLNDYDNSNNHRADGKFGGALSSHISPTSVPGGRIRRPPLVVPYGLKHPDSKNQEMISSCIEDTNEHSLLATQGTSRDHHELISSHIDEMKDHSLLSHRTRSQTQNLDILTQSTTEEAEQTTTSPSSSSRLTQHASNNSSDKKEGRTETTAVTAAAATTIGTSPSAIVNAEAEFLKLWNNATAERIRKEESKEGEAKSDPGNTATTAGTRGYAALPLAPSLEPFNKKIDHSRNHESDDSSYEFGMYTAARIRSEAAVATVAPPPPSSYTTPPSSAETPPKTVVDDEQILATSGSTNIESTPSQSVARTLFETPKKATRNELVDSDDESIEFGIALAQRTTGAALFDSEEGDDGSTSTPHSAAHHSQASDDFLNLDAYRRQFCTNDDDDLQLTPGRATRRTKLEKLLLTPAHLRRMRDMHTPRKNRDIGKLTTPEADKITMFEPNSIIATGESDRSHHPVRLEASLQSEDQTAYLALPSMRNSPNKMTSRSFDEASPENKERRKFKFRQRRSVKEEGSGSRDLHSKSIPGDETPNIEIPHSDEVDVGGLRDTLIRDSEKIISNMPSHQESTQKPNDGRNSRLRISPRSPTTVLDNARTERRQDDSLSSPTVTSGCKDESEVLSASECSRQEGHDKSHWTQGCCSDSTEFLKPAGSESPGSAIVVGSVAKLSTNHMSEQPKKPPEVSLIGYESQATKDSASHEKQTTETATLFESFTWGVQDTGDTVEEENENDHSLHTAMSWPQDQKSSLIAPEGHDLGDVTHPGSPPRKPGHERSFSSFGFSRSCENSPSRQEGFHKTMEDMFSNLTPKSRRRLAEMRISESENNEYLSNYFYVVKPPTAKEKLRGAQTSNPTEEGYSCAKDAFCSHLLGMDTMMCGLKLLFRGTKDTEPELPAKPAPVKVRALSVGNEDVDYDDSWLGMLGMNRRTLSFYNTEDSDGSGGSQRLFQFQPPSLKNKTCDKPIEDGGLERNSPARAEEEEISKHQDILKLTESKSGYSTMTNKERWNLIRRVSKESFGSNDFGFDGDDSSTVG